jgi:hypothetical protein
LGEGALTEDQIMMGITHGPQVVYKIVEFKLPDGMFILKRIFDDNNLLLINQHSQLYKEESSNYFFRKYHFMPMEGAINIRQRMQSPMNYSFFIKYYAENGQIEPMEIKPQGININDYKINCNYQNNTI